MKETTIFKTVTTSIMGILSSLFGVLAVPVLLMVGCNIIDYATGLAAAKYRNERVNSYKSLKGIIKKICLWLLVVVGAIIDQLLLYTSETIGFNIPFTFLVSGVVAIWIICNEIISILENMIDIGVSMPGFLLPLVKNIKGHTETVSCVNTEKNNDGSEKKPDGK